MNSIQIVTETNTTCAVVVGLPSPETYSHSSSKRSPQGTLRDGGNSKRDQINIDCRAPCPQVPPRASYLRQNCHFIKPRVRSRFTCDSDPHHIRPFRSVDGGHERMD